MKNKCIYKFFFILPLPIAFLSCSGIEQSEMQKIKKLQAHKEKVTPLEMQSPLMSFEHKKRVLKPYFWEKTIDGNIPKVTKEFFRCKGSITNPLAKVKSGQSVVFQFDCRGIDDHSLPLRDGKEFVYPALIDILNDIQQQAKSKVIITSGHRCPLHDAYVLGFRSNSKHQIAAEVDFFVEGYKNSPEKIITMLNSYYKKTSFGPLRKIGEKVFENSEVICRIVYDREKLIFDNKISHPYLTLELKYDRASQSKVVYNWNAAHKIMKW